MKPYMPISRLLLFTTSYILLTVCISTHSVIYSQDAGVYIDSTAQFIRGFGAANIVDWYGEDLTLEDVETAYGTEEGQLGFNILRLRISPNPNDWDNGNQVETAKKAHEMGAIVWAAPWNPPASMYDPNSEQRKVNPEMYQEYADHLKDFVDFMGENGVPIYAISVQNEPDYAETWTAWDPGDIVKFLQENAPSIGTKIVAPESFQFRRTYSDPILNDSLASSHTDIIGGHIYGGGTARYPLAEEKGKEIWMTEHYTTSEHSANLWPNALEVGKEIQRVMDVGWNAYIWWQIKRYYSPIHDGVDADTDSYEDRGRVGSITKRGYIMSQFSRFIRPGYHRIHTNGPFGRGYAQVSLTAYKDSLNSRVVLVAVNGENSSKQVNFTIHGATASSFSRYITSEDQDVEQIEDVEISGSAFSTTLPAQSITTFVSSDVVVSNEEQAQVPASYQLKQNYPNPFNPSTNINYVLPEASNVNLKVYDLLGREVATLVNEKVSAGAHHVQFDASDLSSGIYIYRLNTGNFSLTKKMILLK